MATWTAVRDWTAGEVLTAANMDTYVSQNLDFLKTQLETNAQTDSYTLVLADAGKLIEMNKATANNLTVPLNATVAFPVGTTIGILQTGAGQTSVVATGGVTINSTGAKLKLTGQWSAATLIKRATNTWVLVGDITV